jgi:hypothetical protein
MTADLVGNVYEDALGRRLVVRQVNPGASDGRQVVGEIVTLPGEYNLPYATDARVFENIWLNKAPKWEGTN